MWRAGQTLALATLIMLAFSVAASILGIPQADVGPSLEFNWRAFIGGERSTSVPVYIKIIGGRVGVALYNGSNYTTTLVVLDGDGTAAFKASYTHSTPLCLANYQGSFDLIMDRGGGDVYEKILTANGEESDGFSFKTARPALLSGCTVHGGTYYFYGTVAVEGRGMEAYVEARTQAGRLLWNISWGSSSGDEGVLDLVPLGGDLIAVVENASNTSWLGIYVLAGGKAVKLLEAEGYHYASGTPLNESLAALSFNTPRIPQILLVHAQNYELTVVNITGINVHLTGIAGSGGILTVSGFEANTTTGAREGVVFLIDPKTGVISSVNRITGKNDVTPLIIDAQRGQVAVSGLYGSRPFTASYSIIWPGGVSPTSTNPPPGSSGEGFKRVYIVVGGVVAVLIVASIIYYVRRGGRASPK
ncbi:MAG: hypothetical protein F7C35_06230 [Desulfurococcales archaeon]|nr:hypothetical protein [Desulfurococcales archaeon]